MPIKCQLVAIKKLKQYELLLKNQEASEKAGSFNADKH